MRNRRRPVRASKRQKVASRWLLCAYCGRSLGDLNKLTIDHVNPVSRGGKSEIGNLVGCCLTCNHAKADRTPEEWIVAILAVVKPSERAAIVERLQRDAAGLESEATP